jgi:hypothetical protein
MRPSHRVAFYLTHGRWPEPLGCHHCDNRACCNPGHLFEGTDADNNADKGRKGRARNGALTKPASQTRGEQHSTSKLTDALVLYARRQMALGVPHRKLGKELGIHPSCLSRINTRKTWTHV